MVSDRLGALLHRERLDARLVAGASTDGDAALTRRAAVLGAPRARRRVASGLERALRSAGRSGISAAIPVDRHAVTVARPYLAQVIERLRSAAPVAPHGVARALRLITDAAGPLYTPASLDDLRQEAVLVLFWLEPAPQSPDPIFFSADHPNLAP